MEVRRAPSQSFRLSPLLQTVDKICCQWTAVNLLVYGKECGREPEEFGTRVKKILEESQESVFRQESMKIIDTYAEMSLTDLKLYVDTLESLIIELQGSDTLQMIIQSCILYIYEELKVVCMDLDPSKAWLHERTVTMPEVEIPEEFFTHLETQLRFVYILMKKLDGAEAATFSNAVFRILMDFILQDCQTPVKRYEGKMLSRLTAVPKFASAIMSKIDIFWSDMKQKREYRKPLMLLLSKVKFVRFIQDDDTAINDRIKKVLKKKQGPEQEALLMFLVRTCMNMKTPGDNTTKDNMTKLCQEVFKGADKAKKDKSLDRDLIAMMIRSVGLTEGKNFTAYWNKMAAHMQKFAQTQNPVEALKLTRLLGDLYCPEKFKPADYITFCYELMFEKRKIPIIRTEFQDMVDMMIESFVDMAKKEEAPVTDILLNIAQTIPQLKEYPLTLAFLFGTSVKLRKTSSDFVQKFVSAVEPNLQLILTSASPIRVINDALEFLTDFWQYAVLSHTYLPSLLQELSGHSESDVVEKTALAFIEMMKVVPMKGFLINCGFSILFNLLIKIHNKTPVPVVIRLMNILADFLKDFVVVTKNSESGDHNDDWKALTKTIDKTLFPFLAMNQPAVHASMNKVFAVTAAASEFVTLGSVLRESESIEEALKAGKKRLPIHFADIFETNVKFWSDMKKDTRNEWADAILNYLCILAVPMKGKNKVGCLPNFLKSLITTVLQWDEEKIIEYIVKIDASCWPALIKEYLAIHKKQEGDPSTKFKAIQTAMTMNPGFADTNEGLEFMLSEDDDLVSLKITTAYLRTHPSAVAGIIEKAGSLSDLINDMKQKVNACGQDSDLLYARIDLLSVIVLNVDIDAEFAIRLANFMTNMLLEYPSHTGVITETVGAIAHKQMIALAQHAIKIERDAKAVMCSGLMKYVTKDHTKSELIPVLLFALSLMSTPMEAYHSTAVELATTVLTSLGYTEKISEFLQYNPDVKDEIIKAAKTVLTPEEFTLDETPATSASMLDLIATSEQTPYENYHRILPNWRKLIASYATNMDKFLESIWENKTLKPVIPFIFSYAFDANPSIVASFIISKLPFNNTQNRAEITATTNPDNYHLYGTLSMIFAHMKDKQTAIDCFGETMASLMMFALTADNKYEDSVYPPLTMTVTSVFSTNASGCVCAAVEACGEEQVDKFVALALEEDDIYACAGMKRDRVKELLTLLTERAISGNTEILMKHTHSLTAPMRILEPSDISQFIIFLLSLIYSSGGAFITEVTDFIDTIWDQVKDNAESFKARFIEDLNEAGGTTLVLSVVLSSLKSLSSIDQKQFISCIRLLTTISLFMDRQPHGVLELCSLLLDSLLAICGLKPSGLTEDLSNSHEALTHINSAPVETKRSVITFLLEFTATNSISAVFFRYTLVNLVSHILTDYETLNGVASIVPFLMAQSVTSASAQNKHYVALITSFIRNQEESSLALPWYSSIFGPTELLEETDAGIEMRICAQKFLPKDFQSTKVPEMKAFK